ncbi:MAG: hypothetical protein GY798_20180 [Hyphomicrobiales bacterium]|nr:hypothetical protein [Hyphomicrobiales bacterium]
MAGTSAGHTHLTMMSDHQHQRPFPPLLPVGFHQTDVSGLQRLCVDYFPGSKTRPELMETVSTIVTLANQTGIPAKLWIAGDFLTQAPSPSHLSVSMVLVESVFRSLSAEQREFFEWFSTEPLKARHRCDNYAIVVDANRDDYDIVMRYWMRQFCTSRAPKRGVAEVLVPTLERS